MGLCIPCSVVFSDIYINSNILMRLCGVFFFFPVVFLGWLYVGVVCWVLLFFFFFWFVLCFVNFHLSEVCVRFVGL